MRIGVDARFLGAASYGLAQYSENLLTALSSIDQENDYTVFVGDGLRRKLGLARNYHVRRCGGHPLSLEGLARQYITIRRESFDLYHAHFPVGPVRHEPPSMITVHDVVPFRKGGRGSSKRSMWDRVAGLVLYPATMREVRWVLCVSNATRDALVEHFPYVFHKTVVVNSGVEDLYRAPCPRERLDEFRTNRRPPGVYILYSGSSAQSKNIPGMLEAFAALRQQEPRAAEVHFVLDITDNPGAREDFGRITRQYGIGEYVHFLTDLSAVERRALFHGAASLFIASPEEGFGFPVIRAQLCGVPVVAADAGALPEVCGEGGLLVDPANTGEMVSMLSRALFDQDLREYLVSRGRENAERFSWLDTARRMLEIYELLF